MNWPYLAVGALAGVILIVFASYVTITGFTVNEDLFGAQLGAAYTEQANMVLGNQQEHEFVPTVNCYEEGCGLTSLKISGEIRANRSGAVRMYIDDGRERYLVLEESILLSSHEITESVMSEENVSFFNETTNETEVQTFYISREVNYTIEEPSTTSFKQACHESCEFFLASRVMYYLNVEAAEGIEVEIENVTYTWDVPGREIPDIEVLNESDINATEPENKTNMTLSPPIVSVLTGLASVDFSTRENASSLPANWFIKSDPNLEDVDAGEWEWNPYSEGGGIVLPLAAMKRPQEEYLSVELRIYSRTIPIEENASLQFELDYRDEAKDGCVQIVLDTYDEGGTSATSYILTLSENPDIQGEDFDSSLEKSGENVTLRVRMDNPLVGRKAQFSFVPLCDNGVITVKNLTYTFINNFGHS
jgi:hypothetical protein